MSAIVNVDICKGRLSTQMLQSNIHSPAVSSFVGNVREKCSRGGELIYLYIEAYPKFTLATLQQLATSATKKYQISQLQITHAYGLLLKYEPIVVVHVAANTRQPAIDCCNYVIEQLKTSVGFWKKEVSAISSNWVVSETKIHSS